MTEGDSDFYGQISRAHAVRQSRRAALSRHGQARPAPRAISTAPLDCTYCYYLSKEKLLNAQAKDSMDDMTLERFVEQYIEAVTGDSVVFIWQGGEPTLLGLQFFHKVIAFQKICEASAENRERFTDQRTLITEEWCEFLKANRFLVGLSIDGPRDIHDHYRVTKGNKPTFDKVVNASKLLKLYNVSFNTLTCVHRFNAKRPLGVYRLLRREIGFHVHPVYTDCPCFGVELALAGDARGCSSATHTTTTPPLLFVFSAPSFPLVLDQGPISTLFKVR